MYVTITDLRDARSWNLTPWSLVPCRKPFLLLICHNVMHRNLKRPDPMDPPWVGAYTAYHATLCVGYQAGSRSFVSFANENWSEARGVFIQGSIQSANVHLLRERLRPPRNVNSPSLLQVPALDDLFFRLFLWILGTTHAEGREGVIFKLCLCTIKQHH